MTGNDISPAIPNHKAFFEVDFPFFGSLDQHAGFWFTTAASRILPMRTNQNVIDWRQPSQLFMHCINRGHIDQAVTDIRLIRYNDHQQPGLFQILDGADDTGQKPEILQSAWRVRFPIAHLGAIDDAVAIKKNRRA